MHVSLSVARTPTSCLNDASSILMCLRVTIVSARLFCPLPEDWGGVKSPSLLGPAVHTPVCTAGHPQSTATSNGSYTIVSDVSRHPSVSAAGARPLPGTWHSLIPLNKGAFELPWRLAWQRAEVATYRHSRLGPHETRVSFVALPRLCRLVSLAQTHAASLVFLALCGAL